MLARLAPLRVGPHRVEDADGRQGNARADAVALPRPGVVRHCRLKEGVGAKLHRAVVEAGQVALDEHGAVAQLGEGVGVAAHLPAAGQDFGHVGLRLRRQNGDLVERDAVDLAGWVGRGGGGNGGGGWRVRRGCGRRSAVGGRRRPRRGRGQGRRGAGRGRRGRRGKGGQGGRGQRRQRPGGRGHTAPATADEKNHEEHGGTQRKELFLSVPPCSSMSLCVPLHSQNP